eukprot:s641_g10.t1
MSPLAFIIPRPGALGGYGAASMVHSQGSTSRTPSMATGGIAAVTLAVGLLGVQVWGALSVADDLVSLSPDRKESAKNG